MDPLDVIEQVTDKGIHLATRTILLFGYIDNDMALKLQGQLMALSPMQPGGVTVLINSDGGEESAGFAMYDMLMACSCTVKTVGVGSVMSIAALVFQAGDFRHMTPECRMMVHNGTYSFGKGDIQQNHIIDYAQGMKSANKRYATIIAERSGLSVKKVQGWCRGDKFFSANEAVSHHLADAILCYPPKRMPL